VTINRCDSTPGIQTSLEINRSVLLPRHVSVTATGSPEDAELCTKAPAPVMLQDVYRRLCDRSHIEKLSADGRHFQLAGMNPAGLTFANDNGLLRSVNPA
jgi:hypothetical protein